jgi:hypothetical protein
MAHMMNLKIGSHTGKIGRLPREIRNELGQALYQGVPAVRLVAWLNTLPEVQAILASDFGGQPINNQNLSKWKVRGYPDWLQEQAFMQGMRQFSAKQFEAMNQSSASPTALTPNQPES